MHSFVITPCPPRRENAEAIAFYGGDVREAADLSHRNQEVFAVLLWRILWLGGYEFWLVIYRCVWLRVCAVVNVCWCSL
jgi:ABC-type uncharacterized transport system fused permease/ATPase subunit